MAFLDNNGLQHLIATIKTKLDSKSDKNHEHNYAGSSSAGGAANSAIKANTLATVITAGSGAEYTAVVNGIDSLVAGANFIMIPHTQSTTVSPTLNVNNLGAKALRQQLTNSTSSTTSAANTNWLGANKPVRVTYNGTFWVADLVRPNAANLYGVVSIEHGGTGADNAADARVNLGIETPNGTTTSGNADYAEVGEWVDGNPNDEDRIGYFVAIDENTSGTTMVKATSTSDVRGVTVAAPAFSGNCSPDKFDTATVTEPDPVTGEEVTKIVSTNLKKQYDYVAVMGLVSVIDNGTCTINGRCMPTDDGTAVPSPNNMGYQVIDRIDPTHVLIAVEPSADMLVRIKEDVAELQTGKVDASELQSHTSNSDIHITSAERNAWNAKANANDLTSHTSNTTVHITADERTKWNNHANAAHAPSNAEVNQNAFSNVKVGSTTVAADTKTDTLELVGNNVTLTPDATNDKVTIGITKDNVTTALGYTPPTKDTTYNPATTSAAGLMSAADKTKLDGIATGAQVNQNAFSNVTVGETTVSADSTTDTLTFVAGSNVTITPDANNDAITIAAKDTTYAAATTSAAGLMSAADKTKLDGIATGANKYTLPVAGSALGGVKSGTDITVDSSGNVSVNNDSHTHTKDTITSVNASAIVGTIPTANLPSYVDDVLEYSGKSSFPTTGEAGKIYVDTTTNKPYRWSGSDYVEISSSLALGETSSTAYRGDYGAVAYKHAVTNKGSAFSSGLYKITTNSEGHVTAATAVTKSDITALGIPASDTNTDTKVTQTLTSENAVYPLLLAPNAQSATTTTTAYFDSGVTLNPSTNTIIANISGNASGNAGTATKLATARTINGTSFDGSANITTANWGTARNIYISDADATNTSDPVSVNGAGNATLKLPSVIKATLSGNASTATTASSCTGNASTASKWANARTLSFSGDATGSMSVDGSADKNAALTLVDSGVTAGSYGPSANVSPAHSGTFTVPYITVDKKGRVTAASTKTITLPSDNDTKNTAGSTDTSSKIYLVGATSQAANPQTYSDDEIYATSGVLTTKKVQVGGTAATIEYDSTNKCINFVFA